MIKIRTIEDINLYTKYERFKAGEKIFDYLFENCIFCYDEIIIKKNNNCISYTYKIRNVLYQIIIDKEAKIYTELKYNKSTEKGIFNISDGIIGFNEYKEILLNYFDKMLYAIYLSVTDINFKVKNIDGIKKNFNYILKGR